MLEVDHIIPYCEGGMDAEDNLVTACRACNRGKEALRMQGRHNGARGKQYQLREYPEGAAKERILKLLAKGGATSLQISQKLNLSAATARSRLSNLKAAGLIKKSGFAEGGLAIWHLVP